VKARSVDLVFTSPPYLNAIDYLRCSKFSLVWMGYTISELRLIRSESIGSYSSGECHAALETIARRECDWDGLSSRAQGILARYLSDTEKSLKTIKRVLSPSGRAVYVVGENCIEGVYVPTGPLVRAIAKIVGLRAVRGRVRPLPAGRRYMPPPRANGGMLDGRMNQEVIVNLRTA
jgi:DNA modification methylase